MNLSFNNHLSQVLDHIAGCKASSLVSLENGDTLYSFGDIDIDAQGLNRDLSRIMSPNLSRSSKTRVKWLTMRYSPKTTIFAAPVSEDCFWSIVIYDHDPTKDEKAYIDKIAHMIRTDIDLTK